ncbi:putative myosin light chain kinase [Cladobotryum mycophilum]|uniref:non-specific serine/threonine protein kinase n=1 Tax=Cladobotryum mycophilum TaxID=491253 RepID=A0ABR0T3M9_9HYPO
MEPDSNVFATLYPYDPDCCGWALYTVRMDENRDRRFIPQVIHQDRKPLSSRQPSVPPDEEEPQRQPSPSYSEGLQLRFDQPRKSRHGILIGQSVNCDIVLPNEGNLVATSQYQCLITFDDQEQLILRDIRDPTRKGDGTAVIYNTEGRYKRRGFTWIIGGARFAETEKIQIRFHDCILFFLVVAQHDILCSEYRKKVAQFRNLIPEEGVNSPTFQDLELNGPPSTTLLTGAQTPSRVPIFVGNLEIGDGSQAVVKKVWNVSTGVAYAAKEPKRSKYWKYLKKEAEFLKKLHHSNIVQCIFIVEEELAPRIILEYLPLGSLQHQSQKQPITPLENVQVLIQGLSALCFLHERPKPIAHRDIKPGNILVQSRTPLLIKLSDFGLSKVDKECLETYCGTHKYMAPEIWSKRYNEAVDIWSLGLVALQFAHGFPKQRVQQGSEWAEAITKYLEAMIETLECPMLDFLAQEMLLVEPHKRSSARNCYKTAHQLEVPACCAVWAIPPISPILPGSEDDGTTIVPGREGKASEDLASREDSSEDENDKTVVNAEAIDEKPIVKSIEENAAKGQKTTSLQNPKPYEDIADVPTPKRAPSTILPKVTPTKRTASQRDSAKFILVTERRTKRSKSTASELPFQPRPGAELRYVANHIPNPDEFWMGSSLVAELGIGKSIPSESSLEMEKPGSISELKP